MRIPSIKPVNPAMIYLYLYKNSSRKLGSLDKISHTDFYGAILINDVVRWFAIEKE